MYKKPLSCFFSFEVYVVQNSQPCQPQPGIWLYDERLPLWHPFRCWRRVWGKISKGTQVFVESQREKGYHTDIDLPTGDGNGKL